MIVVLRSCAQHGPQSHWREIPRDLENPRSPRIYECEFPGVYDGTCGLELGRAREYVSLPAVLEAVLAEAKPYTDKPRRVVEKVERRLRRKPRVSS